jgi:signal transduction histidine kinase
LNSSSNINNDIPVSKPMVTKNKYYSAPRFLRREGCHFPVLPDLESSSGFDQNRRKLLLELEQLNHLLDAGVGINQFFDTIVKVTADNSRASYVALAIKEEDPNHWAVKAKVGALDSAAETVCQQILVTDACALFENSKAYVPSIDRLEVNDSLIVLMCVPFFVDGQVIGGMTLVREGSQERFSGPDINLTSIMGQWCSLKLTNIGLLSDLKESRDHEQQLLARVCRSQEEERRRVSAELHDGVAQWMVTAAYDVTTCQDLLTSGNNENIAEALSRVKDTLQTCLKELRRAIANLRPLPIAELGLVGALNKHARQLTNEGLCCTVHVESKMPPLSIAEESTVFWIIQEALNNIRKHAGADNARIQILPQDDRLTVRIKDDGKGFDQALVESNAVPMQRLGLTGMKERAELLGGNLEVVSALGQGTEICFWFKFLSSSSMVYSGGKR